MVQRIRRMRRRRTPRATCRIRRWAVRWNTKAATKASRRRTCPAAVGWNPPTQTSSRAAGVALGASHDLPLLCYSLSRHTPLPRLCSNSSIECAVDAMHPLVGAASHAGRFGDENDSEFEFGEGGAEVDGSAADELVCRDAAQPLQAERTIAGEYRCDEAAKSGHHRRRLLTQWMIAALLPQHRWCSLCQVLFMIPFALLYSSIHASLLFPNRVLCKLRKHTTRGDGPYDQFYRRALPTYRGSLSEALNESRTLALGVRPCKRKAPDQGPNTPRPFETRNAAV